MTVKWSAFTAGSAIAAANEVVGLQSGVNVRWTYTQVAAFLSTATLAAGTITTSQPMTLTQTWNAGGVTFIGHSLDFTDTASAAGSLPFRIRGGASATSVLFSVSKAGALVAASGLTLDGHQIFTTDNTYDIGASGATRPKNVYVAGITTSNQFLANGGGGAGFKFIGFTGYGMDCSGSSTDLYRDSVRMFNLNAGGANVAPDVATPAAGSTSARLLFGTTAGFGIYYGSDAPTVSAAQGSLYLRSNGDGVANRAYINTNGTTGWTAIATAG